MTIMNMVSSGSDSLIPKYITPVFGASPYIDTEYFNVSHSSSESAEIKTAYYMTPSTSAMVYDGRIIGSFAPSGTGYYRAIVTNTSRVISSSDLTKTMSINSSVSNELADSGKAIFALCLYINGGAKIRCTTDHPLVILEGTFTKSGDSLTITAPIGGKTIGELFGDYPYMYNTSSIVPTSNNILSATLVQLENN